MKRKFTVIFIIILAGCTNNPHTTVSNVNSKSSDSEEFDKFLTKFNNDSVFQISNIKFPFLIESYEMGDNGEDIPVQEFIDRTEWNIINLQYKDDYRHSKVDAYTQEIKYSVDTVAIEVRGIDNGMYFRYDFIKKGKSWILISLTDWST